MNLNVPLSPDVETKLLAKAKAQGSDVVHLVQLAISRFIADEMETPASEPWSDEKNARRCYLIDKEIAGSISLVERNELATLQRLAEAYFDEVASPDLEGATKLHQRLTNSDSI